MPPSKGNIARELFLAYRLFARTDLSQPWQILLHESRALELFAGAMATLDVEPVAPVGSIVDLKKLGRLRDLIDSAGAEPLSLAKFAKEVGMAIITMQRYFQAVYGMTVIAYMREQA
jgi:AraC-like DNA-binding protein